MSDPHPTLPTQNDITIAQSTPRGMITLRGNLSNDQVLRTCATLIGTDVPARRAIATNGDKAMAWMSPDELLLMMPHAEAPEAVQTLNDDLKGQHFLAANVSDARALFTISGPHWRDAVTRLSPMDLRDFGPGELRRTRFGQAAAAIWQSGASEASLICFRSLAGYMSDLLTNAARSGRL